MHLGCFGNVGHPDKPVPYRGHTNMPRHLLVYVLVRSDGPLPPVGVPPITTFHQVATRSVSDSRRHPRLPSKKTPPPGVLAQRDFETEDVWSNVVRLQNSAQASGRWGPEARVDGKRHGAAHRPTRLSTARSQLADRDHHFMRRVASRQLVRCIVTAGRMSRVGYRALVSLGRDQSVRRHYG
jgi:hypothetical protein